MAIDNAKRKSDTIEIDIEWTINGRWAHLKITQCASTNTPAPSEAWPNTSPNEVCRVRRQSIGLSRSALFADKCIQIHNRIAHINGIDVACHSGCCCLCHCCCDFPASCLCDRPYPSQKLATPTARLTCTIRASVIVRFVPGPVVPAQTSTISPFSIYGLFVQREQRTHTQKPVQKSSGSSSTAEARRAAPPPECTEPEAIYFDVLVFGADFNGFIM